ncbi:TAFII28-domain-containing protein [Marasmius fiardii PR-910]|nr:TAFII28-domain-containing protein [Marasmius fiardii PR-910]
MTADIAAAASPAISSPQFQHVHWSLSNTAGPSSGSSPASLAGSSSVAVGGGPNSNASIIQGPSFAGPKTQSSVTSGVLPYGQVPGQQTPTPGTYSSTFLRDLAASANLPASTLEAAGLVANLSNAERGARVGSLPPTKPAGGDEDGEGDDELFPAMADDDYSAQLSFQSQSKDNLKVLMENLSPEQYDRFEAYRRHALPKQAVRKVIQQTVGAQVSQPVAQIIAGFSKVFVGEIVEKARAVQARRGDTGPLSPDHLREAYRMYQEETGRVGAARPVRAKKLFVR